MSTATATPAGQVKPGDRIRTTDGISEGHPLTVREAVTTDGITHVTYRDGSTGDYAADSPLAVIDPEPGFWDGAEVIHTYTRAQAIRDEQLRDVSALAREAGFVWPVAVTAAVWADAVAWTEADEKRKPGGTGQDETGRLWDVLNMARHAAAGRLARKISPTLSEFRVLRVPREGRGVKARYVTLHLHTGPGDNAEPVVTITLSTED